MGDLSPHFDRSEFKCKCRRCSGTHQMVDAGLIRILEETRKHFRGLYFNRQVFITITSGHRCLDHNLETHGASVTSMHLGAGACDFVVNGVSSEEVYDYINKKYPDTLGLCLYDDRVHMDMRRVPWRGDKRDD